MKHTKARRIRRILIAMALACMLFVGGTFGMVCYLENTIPQPGSYGAMIVLGSRVNMDGTPSINLTFRLEAALASWQETPCLIICCGAQGADEPAPEGDVMRDWLIARGVPADQVLSETASFNTAQSIRNAAAMLEERGITGALMLTSAYHVPRAMALAEDEGLSATGVGSPCKNDIVNWTRNHGRETLSWVKYLLVKYLRLPLE